MKLIPVRDKGGVVYATVDDEDAARCQRYWRMHKGYPHTKIYARKVNGRSKQRDVPMHRFIIGEENLVGLEVDHRNRDKLDYRRENLRVVTKAQNAQNVGPQRRNRSGIRGAHAVGRRWQARARRHSLGYFDTAEEAGRAAAAFRAQTMPFSA